MRLFTTLAVLLLCGSLATAGFLVSTDRTSYTGNVTRYATLADAQAGTNALGTYGLPDRATAAPYNTPYRDVAVYFVHDAATLDVDASIFMTAWYYTTNAAQPAYSGWGNPNNTNTGFTQLYDADASTNTSAVGYWNNSLDQFTLQASGVNADYANDYARFWHAPGVGGAGGLTRGKFVSWVIDATYGGLSASYNAGLGGFEATGHPGSVSGTFTAIFENDNVVDAQYNGFYAINFTFGLDNWAYGNQADLNGAFIDSYFFSTSVIPAPGAVLLGALGVVLMVLLRRK